MNAIIALEHCLESFADLFGGHLTDVRECCHSFSNKAMRSWPIVLVRTGSLPVFAFSSRLQAISLKIKLCLTVI